MTLYDLDGSATGSATVNGSLSVLAGLSGVSTGAAIPSTIPSLIHYLDTPVSGGSSLTVDPIQIFNMSGFLVGKTLISCNNIGDLVGVITGSAILSGYLDRFINLSGLSQSAGALLLSIPDPIVGTGVVSAYLDLIHTPLPICSTPTVSTEFRWGHQFTKGDLELFVQGPGGNPVSPVSVEYYLCQMQPGCVLRRVGPLRRTPVNYAVGRYYATGSAGECGQPGLWAIKWCYRITYGMSVTEVTCYFNVVDSVASPVSGDTLERYCKYGWD